MGGPEARKTVKIVRKKSKVLGMLPKLDKRHEQMEKVSTKLNG